MREPMDAGLRTAVRWLWLDVQGHRCGVCGVGAPARYGVTARWVLDYVRDHDGAVCASGDECVDCVQGTTCRICMLHLNHVRRWDGYVPRSHVQGVPPRVWLERARAYVAGDFRRLNAGRAEEAEEAYGGVAG